MSRFIPGSRSGITPRLLQELCHGILQIPVPMITAGRNIEDEVHAAQPPSWLQETLFPSQETWLDIPIRNLKIEGFKVRASSGLGIAFPGLWTTLSNGFSGSRIQQGCSNGEADLNDTTLYFSSPEIEHNAMPGSQSHWPPEMSSEPFQALQAWVKRRGQTPELVAIGLEGQGLLFVA